MISLLLIASSAADARETMVRISIEEAMTTSDTLYTRDPKQPDILISIGLGRDDDVLAQSCDQTLFAVVAEVCIDGERIEAPFVFDLEKSFRLKSANAIPHAGQHNDQRSVRCRCPGTQNAWYRHFGCRG